MWSVRQSKTLSNTRSSKACLSSRVPGLRALFLTWALPVEVLLERQAEELWAWSECLVLPGSLPAAGGIQPVHWPGRLQRLVLEMESDDSIAGGVVWPVSLQQLSVGGRFNQSIAGVVWPASVQQLSFGDYFNQPIVGVVWPASLQKLSFGDDFNQRIARVGWPASLQQLSFGWDFNRSIVGVVWPSSVQQLSFEGVFNRSIVGVKWPTSMQQLSFEGGFNRSIVGVRWPASVQQLSFGDEFNQPIAGVVWPASLQKLSFGDDFNQPIAEVAWPASLQQLSFGRYFNQPIVGGFLAGFAREAIVRGILQPAHRRSPVADIVEAARARRIRRVHRLNFARGRNPEGLAPSVVATLYSDCDSYNIQLLDCSAYELICHQIRSAERRAFARLCHA